MDSIPAEKISGMKRASIDIGTNSVLLLVAEYNTKSGLTVLHETQELPRLGEGVDKDRKLSTESQIRVIKVLKSYKAFLTEQFPELVHHTIVTATSAVRDASNRDSFLESVFSETGWKIRLLTGYEEAQITYKGALSVLEIAPDERYVVLDIGGGSTEIARGIGSKLIDGISLDMGSVRFTERFFNNLKSDRSSVQEIRSEVMRNLETIDSLKKPFSVVGVAGTVSSIAAIALGLKNYDSSALNGYRLSRIDIENYITEFMDLTSQEIEEKNPAYLKGRGDVILAGIIILSEFLNWCESDSLLVSTGGIRHGVVA